MEQEKLEIRLLEIKTEVKNSTTHSLRKKTIVQRAVRVFKDRALGLAAAQGEISFDDLTRKAKDALVLKLPWEYPLPQNLTYERNLTAGLPPFDEKSVLDLTESILGRLRPLAPDFILSGSVSVAERTINQENSLGVALSLTTRPTEVGFLFKHKDSASILDGAWGGLSLKEFDSDEFLARYQEILEGFRKTVPLSAGKKKVVFVPPDLLFSKFREALRGDRYHLGASLFSGKIGQPVFSSQFTLNDSNDLFEQGYVMPFDGEGVIRETPDFPLIENGVLKNVIFDLRNGAKFKAASTGNGFRSYSSNPDIGFNIMRAKPGTRTLAELAGGDEVIFVFIASGGDFVDNGDFSTPVQLAFGYRDGKIIGRYPQLAVKSNLFKMFGDDLVGVARDSFSRYLENPYIVTEMAVEVLGNK
jgi:PmbA protein